MVEAQPLSAAMATASTYSNTNFLCVVLLSPNPQGILEDCGPSWLGACRCCAVPMPLGLARRVRQCAGQCDGGMAEAEEARRGMQWATRLFADWLLAVGSWIFLSVCLGQR